MKVSIIVPNYNYGHFLDRRLQSILNQTYQDFEIIILDDASTDNSLQVIKKYQIDSRVKVYTNEKNSGNPFVQWNLGVGYAHGDFIWIAEADDFCENNFLEKLVSALIVDRSVGLAYCQSWIVDFDGNIIGSWDIEQEKLFSSTRWSQTFTNLGVEEVRNYLFLRNTIPNASAVVFRRDLYLKVGGADVSFIACGDWITWSRMLLENNVTYISEKLNYHRSHRSNVRQAAKGYGLIESYKVKNALYEETEISTDMFNRGFDSLARSWLFGFFRRRLTFEENKKIYKEASKFDNVEKRLSKNLVIGFYRRIFRTLRS